MLYEDPLWVDALEYTAGNDRVLVAATLHNPAEAAQALGGVLGVSELKVSENAPQDTNVLVAVGRGLIVQPSTSGRQAWLVRGSGLAAVMDSGAAPGTGGQARYDIVYAVVNDASLSGTTNEWTIGIVTGTPATAGTQVEPTIPAQAIPLGRITRTNGDATIANADILDMRVVLGNAPRPVTARKLTATVNASLSTSMAADPDLVLPLNRNRVYMLEGLLMGTGGGTTDLHVDFTFPAGCTLSWGLFGPSSPTANNDDAQINAAMRIATTSPSATLAFGLGGGGGLVGGASLRGFIRVGSTPGNLTLRCCKSDTNNTVQFEADSWLRATPVP